MDFFASLCVCVSAHGRACGRACLSIIILLINRQITFRFKIVTVYSRYWVIAINWIRFLSFRLYNYTKIAGGKMSGDEVKGCKVRGGITRESVDGSIGHIQMPSSPGPTVRSRRNLERESRNQFCSILRCRKYTIFCRHR